MKERKLTAGAVRTAHPYQRTIKESEEERVRVQRETRREERSDDESERIAGAKEERSEERAGGWREGEKHSGVHSTAAMLCLRKVGSVRASSKQAKQLLLKQPDRFAEHETASRNKLRNGKMLTLVSLLSVQ